MAVLLAVSSGYGQTFVPQPVIFNPTPEIGSKQTFIDFDGDGDLDIFSATEEPIDYRYFNTRFYRNDNGIYNEVTNPLGTDLDAQVYTYTFGDADGDNDVDILFVSRTTEVRVITNNGNFNFTVGPPLMTGVAWINIRLYWLDVDGDSDPDILLPNDGPYYGVLLNNNGVYTLSPTPLPEQVISISPADLNNDGLVDLICSVGPYLGNPLRILINQGEGLFEVLTQTLPVNLFDPDKQLWADIDADGDIDFLTYADPPQWKVFKNHFKETGAVDLRIAFNFDPGQVGLPTKADIGDLSGDGLPDVIISGVISTDYYRNTSTGGTIQFSKTNRPQPLINHTDVSILDADNDRDLDFFFMTQGESPSIYTYQLNTATTSPAPGSPTNLTSIRNGEVVTLSWTPPVGTGSLEYVIEMVKDGKFTISSMALPEGKPLRLKWPHIILNSQLNLRKLPGGTYTWRVQAIDAAKRYSTFSSSNQFTISGPPSNFQAHPTDQLTKLNLTWEYTPTPETVYLIQRRSPGVPVQTIAELPGNVFSFQDENLELNHRYDYTILAREGTVVSAPSEVVSKYIAQFTSRPVVSSGNDIIMRSTAVDIDNDDDLDVVYANYNTNWPIATMINNGSGSFTTSGLNIEGNDVAVRDMDNDSDQDIVSIDQSRISVFRNTGGLFTQVYYSTPGEILQYTIEDFNADGRLDILYRYAIINNPYRRYRLLYNQGNLDFQDSNIRFVPDTNTADGTYTVGDFNGDNIPDILLRKIGLNGKDKILKGLPGVGFETVTEEAGLPDGFFPFDFNQDGYLDLLGLYNGITVHLGDGQFNFSESATFPLVDVGYEFWLTLQPGDFDLNGYPDLLYSFGGGNYGLIFGYANAHYERQDIPFLKVNGTPPLIIDLEKDGDLDIIKFSTDQWDADNTLYENRVISPDNSATNAPPSTPTQLTGTYDLSGLTLQWSPSTDDHSPSSAITYNLELKNDLGVSILSSETNASGSFRRRLDAGNVGSQPFLKLGGDLPAGNFLAKVQALDAAFQLSAFSTPLAFTVEPGPENFQVTRLLLNKVKLTWTGTFTAGSTIVIERRTVNTGYEPIAEIPGTATEYIDETIEYNQVYTYRAYALSASVPTAKSNTAMWDASFFQLSTTNMPNGDRSVSVADFDLDGKMDVLMAGPEPTDNALFRNLSNGFQKLTFDIGAPTYVIALAGFDLENDGMVDVLQQKSQYPTSGYAVNSFKNTGALNLSPVTTPFSLYDEMPWYSWDWDYDNDLDIALPSGSGPVYLRNNGAGDYRSMTAPQAGIPWTRTGDLDSDGDEDALGFEDGHYFIYENVAGTFVKTSTNLTPSGVDAGLRLIDYDGDGLLDVHAQMRLFHNLGKGANGEFRFEQVQDGLPHGSAAWADIDHDGDIDLIAGQAIYFNASSTFVKSGTLPTGGYWIDLEGDGDLDMIVPQYGSGTNCKTLINQLIVAGNGPINLSPTSPTNLSSYQDEHGMTLSWVAPPDELTAAAALTYDVIIYGNGNTYFKGPLDPGSGKRNRLANGKPGTHLYLRDMVPGNYNWKVQAIDQSFLGSTYSAEGTFTFLPPAPTANDTVVYRCGRTVNITAKGDFIEWYSDASLTNKIADNVFHPTTTQTVYVTCMVNGTRSVANKVKVTIIEKPEPPIAERPIIEFCPTGARVDMYAEGVAVRWYLTPALTTPVWTNNSYSVSGTPGSKTFYVTQTLQGCEGTPATVSLIQAEIDVDLNFRNDSLIVDERGGTWYEWYRNEVLIQDGPSIRAIKITAEGTYNVIVWKNDCGRLSGDVTIRLISGIDEFITGDTLLVYPNPVSEYVNIVLPSKPTGQLTIYNSAGTIVHDQSTTTATEEVLTLSVSTWPSGLYLLHYIDPKRKLVVRMIKIH